MSSLEKILFTLVELISVAVLQYALSSTENDGMRSKIAGQIGGMMSNLHAELSHK